MQYLLVDVDKKGGSQPATIFWMVTMPHSTSLSTVVPPARSKYG